MIKKIVSVSVGAAVWAVFAAEGVRPQPELIGTVEIAAFSDFQKKVVDLGCLIIVAEHQLNPNSDHTIVAFIPADDTYWR